MNKLDTNINLTPPDRSKLRDYLTRRFSLSELRTLAFDLGIDSDALPHTTQGDFARELIAYCQRTQQIAVLIQQALSERADTDIAQLLQPVNDALPSTFSQQPTLSAPNSNIQPGFRQNLVFISYSHKDRAALERFQVFLKPLVRDDALGVWDDTQIKAGTYWRKEIEQALASAKVAVLLISADFLASDFVYKNELPTLLKAAENRGLVILPIILGPSLLKRSPLYEIQAVNSASTYLYGLDKAKQDELWLQLAERIADLVA